MRKYKVRTVLLTVPLFSAMSPEELERLAGLARPRAYRKGEIVFLETDPGDSLHIVASGCVRVYRVREYDGREKTLSLFQPGEFFGEMAILDERPRSATAQAVEDTVLLTISKQDFLAFLGAYPSAALGVIEVLCSRLREADAQIEALMFDDARERVAGVLLRHGTKGASGGLGLRLTHQELANLAGASRETVTRILSEFAQQDLLHFEGRRIRVESPQKLQETVIRDTKPETR